MDELRFFDFIVTIKIEIGLEYYNPQKNMILNG